MIVTIKDENFAGKILNELSIDFKTSIVSVKDIISQRVAKEVEEYNSKMPAYFNGLVEPSEAEKTLNGFKPKAKKVIDAEQQVYTALHAFQNNGFFVLIDNIQSESLDQQIELREGMAISFIKLTQLVGG